MQIGKVIRLPLKGLEHLLQFSAKPFARADSIESYATRGFIALGLVMLVITIILWGSGTLNYPLSRAHPILQSIYRFIVEKTPLKSFPDSYIVIFAMPVVAYIGLAFWPSKRFWVGEKFADLLFGLLDRSIAFGEWCIEHRWVTLFLIILLVAGFSLGLEKVIRDASRNRVLQQGLDHWIKEIEDLIEHSAFTRQEKERYHHAKLDWNDNFKRLTHYPGGYEHPANNLNEMLDILYLKQMTISWKDFLIDNLPELKNLVDTTRSNLRNPLSASELRAWGLMNILMGRLYVRIATETSDYEYLARALEFFEQVKYENYLPAANNGKGTVYVNAFSAYLPNKTNTQIPQEKLPSLKPVCQDSYQCAVQALRAYEEAASNVGNCSFQDKRRRNNTIDLLMRIAMRYDDVIKGRTNPPIENWVESKTGLASEINRRIDDLMSCNEQAPIIPTTFVTVAQAYGASAKLLLEVGTDATHQKKAAATYLKLANSLEPQIISNWDLSYFCFALSKGEIDPVFKETLEDTLKGMPRGDRLLRKIEQKCQ